MSYEYFGDGLVRNPMLMQISEVIQYLLKYSIIKHSFIEYIKGAIGCNGIRFVYLLDILLSK